VREAAPAYRPRRGERTALYRLLERHWEDYKRVHEERFEPSDGPLRPVVESAVHAYLDCGRLPVAAPVPVPGAPSALEEF